MPSTRVVHFEIHVDDFERAIDFYQKSFDWEIKKWEGPIDYYMVMTGSKDEPGIDGGMVKRQGPAPSDTNPMSGYVCTMEIDNLDNYIEKVKSNGGKIAVPKMAIPTVGWMAYCKDTEGNIFGLMQSDKDAK